MLYFPEEDLYLKNKHTLSTMPWTEFEAICCISFQPWSQHWTSFKIKINTKSIIAKLLLPLRVFAMNFYWFLEWFRRKTYHGPQGIKLWCPDLCMYVYIYFFFLLRLFSSSVSCSFFSGLLFGKIISLWHQSMNITHFL
jgi:hypothetical protein